MSPVRVVLVTNMLVPYRIPLFNLLARQYQLHVIFLYKQEDYRSWDIPQHEIRFSYEFLPTPVRFLKWNASLFGFNPYIVRALHRSHPDVLIIGGWAYVEHWITLIYGKLFHKRIILWGGGSIKRHSRHISMMRKIFTQSVDVIVTYSVAATEVFKDLGKSAGQIVTGNNVGDVEFYFNYVAQYRKDPAYQDEYKDWPRPLLLYVGRLVELKGLASLLEALNRIDSHQNWGLMIVGSGPQGKDLEEFCQQNQMNNVYFVDFQQRDALVRYFALADAFVLPSLREQGAIVLSEALASGLFVLASKYDRVAPDLIKPNENGIFIDPNDIDVLSGQLSEILPKFTTRCWNAEQISRDFMQEQPLNRYAKSIIEGISLVERK
jgi:glycosyltransferase involved in cell wall biosynthesis